MNFLSRGFEIAAGNYVASPRHFFKYIWSLINSIKKNVTLNLMACGGFAQHLFIVLGDSGSSPE